MIKRILGICLISSLAFTSCQQKKAGTDQKTSDSLSAVKDTVSAPLKDSTRTELSKEEMDRFKKSAVGKYMAMACDGGRFSIEIKNSDDKITFDIFDKAKIIKSGEVIVGGKYPRTDGVDINLGNIGGLVQDNKIVVQNSGNNMNPFEHFKQCGDKFLDFIKQK